MASENKFYTKWWFWVIISVIMLAIVGSAFSNSSTDSVNQDSNQNNLVQPEDFTNENIQAETPIIESPRSWHEVITFTGTDNKNTDTFNIKGDKYKLTYTVNPANEYSVFGFFVYPEGETVMYTEYVSLTSGTDSTISYEGVGNYYLKVSSANLNSWTIKIEDYY